ncbi:MAG: queuosine precursor transporter [Victivallaceae bacterium]
MFQDLFFNKNLILFCFQITFIALGNCFCIKKGLEWVTGWLILLVILMNLFIIKRIYLFGLEITACDAFVIGFLSCLNMVREFYDIESARKITKISLIIPLGFLFFSILHLMFIPSDTDCSQEKYSFLLLPSLRTTIASLGTFFLIQFFDIKIFSFLTKSWKRKYFNARSALSLLSSQILDTIIFSYMGLYGLVPNVWSLIIVGILAKGIAVLIGSSLSSVLLHIQPIKK